MEALEESVHVGGTTKGLRKPTVGAPSWYIQVRSIESLPLVGLVSGEWPKPAEMRFVVLHYVELLALVKHCFPVRHPRNHDPHYLGEAPAREKSGVHPIRECI